MSVKCAKKYYEVIDSTDTSPADLAEMYSEDAVLKSPREGTFRGRDEVKRFYELNDDFFASGTHSMDEFYVDGETVICEGTVAGETTAGRTYEGIGLVDVFEFNHEDLFVAHRIYLDYSGILSELPETVPSFDD